nr:MAG: tail collar [Podoviridae sp. ctka020]
MADATKLPTSSQLQIFHWRGKPKLTAGVAASATETTLNWSAPPLDKNGAIIDGGFLMNVINRSGESEMIWVPVGNVSADGYSATGVVRGIDPNGLDYTVGDSDFIIELDGGSSISCVVAPQIGELLRSVLQGLIASGGSGFTMGIDAVGTVTFYRSTGPGTAVGFLRWFSTSGKVEYSNNGSAWNTFDSVTASNLVVASNTDTTPGTLTDKITAGTNIVKTLLNGGGNESIQISTSLPAQVSEHIIYTPAYLTGDTGAESVASTWAAVSNGSFRISVDGVAYNITGINFTGVTTMVQVASTIQAALRAATGGSETVTWSTNHFVITSGNTTSASAITVTSTITSGTVGVDISGAGAADWMDADTGNGVVTNTVLNPSADNGLIGLLSSNPEGEGTLDPGFLGTRNTVPSGVFMPYCGRTAPTGWLLCNGSAVSRSTYADLFGVLIPTVGTPTISIASPAVVSLTSHGLVVGDAIYFTTTGALPTGISANTLYYVISAGFGANSFQISTSRGGAAVNTSGSQSGTHTMKFCPYGLGDGSTTFNVPDLRGRIAAGLNTTGLLINMGLTYGEETHTLTESEMPVHTHDLNKSIGNTVASGGGALGTGAGTFTTQSTGGGQAHNNIQPSIVSTYIIKI